ncbi:phenylalanine--tRNA ligase subunit alpha [Candidatus Microgenomates bacterium]|nr:phenylalanine--tRNA ligase subunit alpha [Candidatus Microgenomates bacterium]
MLREKLLNLKNEALALIQEIKDKKELEEIKIKFLGRKGKVNEYLKEIVNLSEDEKVQTGRIANDVKKAIEEALRRQNSKLETRNSKLEEEWLDVSAPGIKPPQGHLHLITQAIREISSIFEKIGFVRVRYPEIEWDWYSFEGLNMPPNHPARDEWETFFINTPPHSKLGKMVLTPHTSSGQLREMERTKPPIRMININKCYRRQSDISHIPIHHEFEGLVIDKGINITHLKGTIDYFIKNFFGVERKVRLRPFHFQFTEPSFEIDIDCDVCGGKGCRFCKEGWVELAGSGMVHPTVLKNGGIDPKKYTGFAFGWGVERTYMMKEGLKIDDIRLLYSNDLRFLNQF